MFIYINNILVLPYMSINRNFENQKEKPNTDSEVSFLFTRRMSFHSCNHKHYRPFDIFM